MAVPFNAIITVAELQAQALKSLTLDFTDADVITAAEEAIRAATSRIEEHLGRNVVVAEKSLVIYDADWLWDSELEVYRYWSPVFPVVKVLTTGADVGRNTAWIESDEGVLEVDVCAGYRRADQDQAAVTVGVPNCDVLPDLIPDAIRRACIKLAIQSLIEGASGTMGLATRSQQMGGSTVQVERAEVDFETRVLGTIDSFRAYVP